MSEILFTWLNTEVDLSKKIENMEKDFSNGYLLGELLYKFNQLTNIRDFKLGNDRNSKINNFNLLQEVFKNIQVQFNSRVAELIMKGQKGEILKLLYQIRSKLEKKGVNPENLSLKKSNHLTELYSSMKFNKEIPAYDKFNQQFFNHQLQTRTKAQKEVNLERHLSKFEHFKKMQDEKIKQEKELDELRQKIESDEKLKMMKSNAGRYHAFQQQFEQKGIDDWKVNMILKKEMEKKDLDYQFKEAQKYYKMVSNSIRNSELDSKRKIEIFEKNLKNENGDMSTLSGMETTDRGKSFKLANEFSNKLRESITQKIMNDAVAKTERNRRRRKIIVEQSKAQLEIENRRREDQYVQKLFKQSNQEKQLTYETFRVNQIKNIIIENRRLREEMYIERKEMDIKFLEKNEEEFLRMEKEYFQIEIEKQDLMRRDLEIASRQKKRSNHSNLCKKMVELIVDIAEEAFIYQQTNDVEEIDPRVWREWTQIFIGDQSVQNKELVNAVEKELMSQSENENKWDARSEKGGFNNSTNQIGNFLSSDMMSNYNTKYGQTFYSMYTSEPSYTVIDQILDDCEFFDYVHFMGQWAKNIIPNNAYVQINLNELMSETVVTNEKVDPKTAAAKKAPAGKDKLNQDEIYKEEDIDNLIIPRNNLENKYLGDLIDILIELKYNESDSNYFKNIFHQIPIKLSLIGHSFAGKKTQAKILSENYPFKIYIFENLIKHALELLFRLEKPIEINNQEAKMLRSNEIENIKIERAKEEAKFAKIKKLASEMREILRNGESIPDEYYVDLIIEYIKIDFPEKSQEEIEDEIYMRVKRKEEIEDLLEKNKEDKIKRPKSYNRVEQELTQELMKLSLEASRGFVLVNFPNTYNQAKLLEKKLSSYIPANEKPKSTVTLLKESFGLVLDKSQKMLPSKKLIRSGLDFIFHIDTSPNECIRRAFGRRTLPKELLPVKALSDNDDIYTQPTKEVVEVIYHLEDNPPPTNSNICEKLIKLEELNNCESSLATRHLSFDNVIQSVIDFYQPFGFESEKFKMFNRIDGNRPRDAVTHDLIEIINFLVELNERKDHDILKKSDNVSVDSQNALEDSNISNQDHLKEIMEEFIGENEEFINYIKKVEAIKKVINRDLAEILMKIWSRIFENYVKECKSTFKFLRLQRDSLGNNYNLICKKFIEFLKRPSKKQTLLLDFQMKYNKFMDDYPDLIDDPQVKDEHHQEVDDLYDKIFEIIETRKNEAIEERKKIMTSGWIENEMEKLYLNFERLFQSEIDKFIGSLQILRDYYHNLDNRPLVELPFQTIDIIKEEIDPTPIESENDINIFPRLEKLYKTALKIQFQYDEALNIAEKKRLEAITDTSKKAKPDPKANKNVKPGQIAEIEEKKEVFQNEEEMKIAIKNEKGKYRYRITLLKYWGIQCFKNIRKIANSVYGKLEDWIILSIKAENEALTQLANIIRSQIEKEQKIKYELELDTFDVIVNMDVQNFIELPPQPQPAKEIIDHNKFNIKQLKILIQELKTYEVSTDHIRTSTFIDIFIKKYISSKNDTDIYYGIPNLLKRLSFHNYYKFIKHLDPTCSDFINIRHITTYFCLLNSKVCRDIDEHDIQKYCDKYHTSFEELRLTKEDFIAMPSWFDLSENCETLPLYENFNRTEKLKEIIFEVNKDEEDLLVINDLIRIYNLKEIHLDNEKFKNKTYYEALFF